VKWPPNGWLLDFGLLLWVYHFTAVSLKIKFQTSDWYVYMPMRSKSTNMYMHTSACAFTRHNIYIYIQISDVHAATLQELFHLFPRRRLLVAAGSPVALCFGVSGLENPSSRVSGRLLCPISDMFSGQHNCSWGQKSLLPFSGTPATREKNKLTACNCRPVWLISDVTTMKTYLVMRFVW
jgi:hypothetical protein